MLALEIDGRSSGVVQIGFRRARSMEPAEPRRIILIVDHIASAIEAARWRTSARLDAIDPEPSTRCSTISTV